MNTNHAFNLPLRTPMDDLDKILFDINLRRTTTCQHPSLRRPEFDFVAAARMSAEEVRLHYPRQVAFCGQCCSSVIMYASAEHFISGDW